MADSHPARFHALHQREGIFLMPNPWDVGSAKLLAHAGFDALATTSAGLAWALGKLDGQVTRDELVAHVAAVAAAVDVPLNVDSEWCFPHAPGGVGETVRAARRGRRRRLLDRGLEPGRRPHRAARRRRRPVAEVVAAERALADPLVITGRCENHIHGIDDLEDTIARLRAYRDAGVDCAFAPGLTDPAQIRRVVDEVGLPLNVIALPNGPSIAELESAGVRRVSTGGAIARHAYGALLDAAAELRERGTAGYAAVGAPRETLADAFG